VADGPTIQEASIRALELETTLDKVLDTLESTSTSREIPIILMTYINPIFALGVVFCREMPACRCRRCNYPGYSYGGRSTCSGQFPRKRYCLYSISCFNEHAGKTRKNCKKF